MIMVDIFIEYICQVYTHHGIKANTDLKAGKSRKIEIAIEPQEKGRLIEVIQVKCNARNAGREGIYQILAIATVE